MTEICLSYKYDLYYIFRDRRVLSLPNLYKPSIYTLSGRKDLDIAVHSLVKTINLSSLHSIPIGKGSTKTGSKE